MVIMALDHHVRTSQQLKHVVGSSRWMPKFLKSAVGLEDTPLPLHELSPEQKRKHPKLYQPGTIYHLRSLPKQHGEKKKYIMELGDRHDFTEIQLVERMIFDHLPDNYDHALVSVSHLEKVY